MKFKILPKVASFTDAEGVEHKPGEIVELPLSYLGETWLEPVEKPKKAEVPAAKVEPAPAEEKSASPLETKSKGKKSKS